MDFTTMVLIQCLIPSLYYGTVHAMCLLAASPTKRITHSAWLTGTDTRVFLQQSSGFDSVSWDEDKWGFRKMCYFISGVTAFDSLGSQQLLERLFLGNLTAGCHCFVVYVWVCVDSACMPCCISAFISQLVLFFWLHVSLVVFPAHNPSADHTWPSLFNCSPSRDSVLFWRVESRQSAECWVIGWPPLLLFWVKLSYTADCVNTHNRPTTEQAQMRLYKICDAL